MTYPIWYAIAAVSFTAATPLIGIALVALYVFVFTGDSLITGDQAAAASLGALILVIIGAGSISEGNIQRRRS